MNKIIIILTALFLSFNSAVAQEVITDTFIDEQLKDKSFSKPDCHLTYNYENTDKVEIPLQITKTIASSGKYESYEGQPVDFTVAEDVYYDNKILVTKGTKVTARVEIIIKKGVSGIPGELFLTDFQIPGIKSSQIPEPAVKQGQSRTLWILPLKWVLTPFPPTGSFTNIVFGGDAKIKENKIFKLTVYPNWI